MYHPSSVAFIVEGASFNQYVIFLQQHDVKMEMRWIVAHREGSPCSET